MKRTIKLTRIHALNWYGYKESISVDGNLLLAGVTGSGKSILMDLIQLVLVGDQRLIRFNQSATGDRSDRSLKGYCLGDTKEEENGVTQYMRQSAISYVALEFTWPTGKKIETWGLRVEFTSAAEAHGKLTPFYIPESLNRSDFLDAEKRPLDYHAFKALTESKSGRIYPEGIEAYLRDMAQPGHLNYDRNVLRSLLPTAMSFTFLKSFNDFARQFILSADKLDVADVTSSYRTFQGYERDLNELNDQFEKLEGIHKTHVRLGDLRRDRALVRYLEARLRHEHVAEQLQADEARYQGLKREFADEEARTKQLEQTIPELRTRLDGLKASINETPDGRLYNELKSRNEKLVFQIGQLTQVGTTLDQALASRVRNARSWLKELRALPLDMELAPAAALELAIHSLESEGTVKASENLRLLTETSQRAAAEANRAAKAQLDRLAELRRQLGQLRDEISALRIGKLPFPTRLLDSLNHKLPSNGSGLPARHLRELCEVTDERWRPAVEIAFARKFAIVVSSEHYEQAEKIYHSLKASELGNETGRESLINPSKALKLKKQARPGSLAEKLRTSHPVAEAIVSQLFGDLICVGSLSELRALPPEQNGILTDGFMSRGAFVERPRFYDGNPFVGQKGLEQQLAWKQSQAADLEAEERKLMPLERSIRALGDGWRELFEQAPSLSDELVSIRQLPSLRDELQDNISKLNTIDRAKFDKLAKQQVQLEVKLKDSEEELRSLDKSEKRSELRQLERNLQTLRQEVGVFADKFEEVRAETDVSHWLKRMESLLSDMLAEFPVKNVAAAQFNQQYHTFDKDSAAAWEELKAQRRALATAYPKFDDLPTDAESNEAFDKQWGKLKESDIPDYHKKAERERKNWERLFRTQILEKLYGALKEVVDLVTLLNTSLKRRPIGTNTYELRYRRNPDYQTYHELLEASAMVAEDDLFFTSASEKFREAIAHFLKMLTEEPDGSEAARLLDYRHYYEYDMEVVEADGRKTSVDRHSGKFSGGENQSPYFIAILASYLRAYRRYNTTRKQEPSLGLVPIDEAFSKLSGERIKDCITALKAFDLQGVFSMSTGNIPYAFEHCDWLVVVSKEERRNGKRTEIRNIPVSLARESDDARRLMDS
jgi:energy-coupling factor transporter ATP-binding protein EcfA2